MSVTKDIKKRIWPRITVHQKQLIRQLFQNICHFSYIGNNTEAFKLITQFCFSPIFRCLAINKSLVNSGRFLSVFLKVILSKHDKLFLFTQTGDFYFYKGSRKYFFCIQGSADSKKTIHYIPLIAIKDIILQSQLCFLLDAFYEGKYNEGMYGFRKGRNFLQLVGNLYKITDFIHLSNIGLAFLDIKQLLVSISHEVIISFFNVPTE